jgi:hypothetical protein
MGIAAQNQRFPEFDLRFVSVIRKEDKSGFNGFDDVTIRPVYSLFEKSSKVITRLDSRK